ncbi:MAG TPA: LysR family transcriptional regulator [Actinoplanes sp.]
MDLRQLEYFLAVAEELNFTRAAARCHVAQSALSYQIARLEREHAVTLFERTSRSVRLAPAGEQLVPHARQILAGVDLARSELAALSGVLTGHLRLGMISSTSQAAPVVERTLAVFHQRHPGVEIAIRDTGSSTMAEQVRSGELDLAFVGLFADQVPADLVHRVLVREPLVAVVPAVVRGPVPLSAPAGHTGSGPVSLGDRAGHPGSGDLAGRPSSGPVSLRDLAGPFVEMRAESGLRRQVDAAFARAGTSRTIAFELSTSEAIVRFVRLGFGAAVVPRSAVRPRSGVTIRALNDPEALHPISIVHRSPHPSAPAARAFLSLL